MPTPYQIGDERALQDVLQELGLANPRTRQNAGIDFANIRDWDGADPTGNNDNTTEIAQAVAQAAGGGLKFPKGTYLTGASIAATPATQGITIKGDGSGKSVISCPTALSALGATPSDAVPLLPIIDLGNNSSPGYAWYELRGLTIRGGGAYQTPYTGGIGQLFNAGVAGLRMQQRAQVTDVRVENCDAGFVANSNTGGKLFMERCSTFGNTDGLWFQGSFDDHWFAALNLSFNKRAGILIPNTCDDIVNLRWFGSHCGFQPYGVLHDCVTVYSGQTSTGSPAGDPSAAGHSNFLLDKGLFMGVHFEKCANGKIVALWGAAARPANAGRMRSTTIFTPIYSSVSTGDKSAANYRLPASTRSAAATASYDATHATDSALALTVNALTNQYVCTVASSFQSAAATSTFTGTSGVSGSGTAVDSAANLTVNAFTGFWVVGANASGFTRARIASNTATTLTTDGWSNGKPTDGTVFTIGVVTSAPVASNTATSLTVTAWTHGTPTNGTPFEVTPYPGDYGVRLGQVSDRNHWKVGRNDIPAVLADSYGGTWVYETSGAVATQFDAGSGTPASVEYLPGVSRGTGTIAAGQTAVTITPGVQLGPNAKAQLQITATSDSGGAVRFWVSAATATTFTVTCAPATTNDLTFNWTLGG